MSNSAMPAPTSRRVSTPVLGSVADDEVVPDVEVESIGGGVVRDESGGLELSPEPLLEEPELPELEEELLDPELPDPEESLPEEPELVSPANGSWYWLSPALCANAGAVAKDRTRVRTRASRPAVRETEAMDDGS